MINFYRFIFKNSIYNKLAMTQNEWQPSTSILRNKLNPFLTDNERVEENTLKTAELIEALKGQLANEANRNGQANAAENNKGNDATQEFVNSLVVNHLNSCYGYSDNSQVQEGKDESASTVELGPGCSLEPLNPIAINFGSDCEWINVENPPILEEESANKIIILEFFTHCCINCIHSIEDVRQVYYNIVDKLKANPSAKKCGLKIISVHSPKFTREKESDSVRSFVKRNRMNHTDVVNDPNNSLWTQLSIFCWPTLLIFGPNNNHDNKTSKLNLLYTLVGEGHKEELQILLQNALEYFDSKLDSSNIQKLLLNQTIEARTQIIDDPSNTDVALQFPGKVLLYKNLLVLSDSGNNRIFVCNTQGHVQEIIGGLDNGYVNGDFISARFYNPQGLAFYDDNILYVADTGNHAVRKINLKTKQVSTLVEPNAVILGENDAVIHLKSPWDLAFYEEGLLLVAAAGNHQIFGYAFAPITLFSKVHLPNSFDLIAGTGKEENKNNMYILKASFCQPSGLCVSHVQNENDKAIYVADSESSTIRVINAAGRVMPLVGGSKDPSDLFVYGDVDGCSYDVRLQHPVGVCSAIGSPRIFIADTYNHKVKMIDCETKHCTTIIGDGTAGDLSGSFSGYVHPKKRSNPREPSPQREIQVTLARLNEPNGIAIDQNQTVLYIADSNNHCIKVANMKSRTVAKLDLKLCLQDAEVPTETQTDSNSTHLEKFDQEFYFEVPSKLKTYSCNFLIHGLPETTEGGEWKLSLFDNKALLFKGQMDQIEGKGRVLVQNLMLPDHANLALHVDIYFCGENSCFRRALKFHLIIVSNSSVDENENIGLEPLSFEYYPPTNLFKEG